MLGFGWFIYLFSTPFLIAWKRMLASLRPVGQVPAQKIWTLPTTNLAQASIRLAWVTRHSAHSACTRLEVPSTWPARIKSYPEKRYPPGKIGICHYPVLPWPQQLIAAATEGQLFSTGSQKPQHSCFSFEIRQCSLLVLLSATAAELGCLRGFGGRRVSEGGDRSYYMHALPPPGHCALQLSVFFFIPARECGDNLDICWRR